MSAVPRTAVTQASAGGRFKQPLRGSARAYAWQCPPAAIAAQPSTGPRGPGKAGWSHLTFETEVPLRFENLPLTRVRRLMRRTMADHSQCHAETVGPAWRWKSHQQVRAKPVDDWPLGSVHRHPGHCNRAHVRGQSKPDTEPSNESKADSPRNMQGSSCAIVASRRTATEAQNPSYA